MTRYLRRMNGASNSVRHVTVDDFWSAWARYLFLHYESSLARNVLTDFSYSYAHVARSCCSHLLSSASPSDDWNFLALRNTSVQLTALWSSRLLFADRASFICLSSSSFDNALPDCSCSLMDSSTEIRAWTLDRSSSAVLRWLTRLMEMEVKAMANNAWGK